MSLENFNLNICRLCLSSAKLSSIFEDNSLAKKLNKYLQMEFNNDDSLPKSICSSCLETINDFDALYNTAIESNKKLQQQKMKSREEDTEGEESLVEALQIDGDNLRLNFTTVPDDNISDKSLEIPPSIAKDIDRILAMTAQLEEDISGETSPMISCDFCQQNNNCQQTPLFGSQKELNEHLKSAHSDITFHCDSCSNMIDRNLLLEHMMQHLKESLTSGAPPEALPIINTENNNERPIKPSTTVQKKSKKQQVQDENHDDDDDEEDVKHDKNLLKEAVGSNVKFLKKCRYCDKLFSNRSGRLYHQEQAHLNRRRFTCDKCSLSFGLKQTLMNHIRNKHSVLRAFQCDMCEKSYKTKSALHNHRVYHSKDDPKYHCNYCEKKFHFNFLLQQHEKIHLGISKSFECSTCHKNFNTRNKLTKHKGIHDNQEFSCKREGCTFKGNLKRYLIAHEKRMHT